MSIKDSMADAAAFAATKITDAASSAVTKVMSLPTDMKESVINNLHQMANPKPSP